MGSVKGIGHFYQQALLMVTKPNTLD